MREWLRGQGRTRGVIPTHEMFTDSRGGLATDERLSRMVAARPKQALACAQIRKLQASLSAFGRTNLLLVDDVGNLVCGNGRLEAAIANGETQVPVFNFGAMSEADLRAYIIADNRLTEGAAFGGLSLK